MCGRYVQARASADLVSDLQAELPLGVEIRPSWNVAPTAEVPILLERLDDDAALHRELHLARWGLLPRWAKELSFSSRTFNARSETVAEKASFRAAVRSQRCAVPATAYYEWLTEGSRKTPHAVRPSTDDGILFAGLYSWWRDPAAGADAEWRLTCTILTGAAPQPEQHEQLAGLHDRMPLALSRQTMDEWLQPQKLEREEAQLLVEQIRQEAYQVASSWEVYPVDRAVGNVRNNSPELLEPAGGLW